jgi:hypothetical protein
VDGRAGAGRCDALRRRLEHLSSNFIQMFRLPDGDDEPDDVEREPPRWTWFGPPEDELGAVVPLQLVVGRSENGVVALPYATVYSSGVAFDVVARARGLSDAESNRLFHEQHLFEEDGEPSPASCESGSSWPAASVSRTSTAGSSVGST